jgi:hypothetical protein
MLSKFKQLFRRGKRTPGLSPLPSDDTDLDWLEPPLDPLDVPAWDRYWTEQIRHGLGPPIFDMFCDDRCLVEVMNSKGLN